MVRRKNIPILSRANGGAMADYSSGLLLGHLDQSEAKQMGVMLRIWFMHGWATRRSKPKHSAPLEQQVWPGPGKRKNPVHEDRVFLKAMNA